MPTPAYDDSNVFAKIIRGELPAAKVFEDEHVLVIMDVMPQGPGHTLVIPKAASRNMLDIDAEDLEARDPRRAARRPRREEGLRRARRVRHAVQRAGRGPDRVPHALPRHPALRGRGAEAAFGRHGRRRSCSPSTRRRSRRRCISRATAPTSLLMPALHAIADNDAQAVSDPARAHAGLGGLRRLDRGDPGRDRARRSARRAVAEPARLDGGRDPRRQPHALPADRHRRALHGRPRRQFRHLPSGLARPPQQDDLRHALRLGELYLLWRWALP